MKWQTYRVLGFLSFALAIVVIPFCWDEVFRTLRATPEGRYVFIAPFLLPSILWACLGYYLLQKARLTLLGKAFATFRENEHSRTPQERLAFYKAHAASLAARGRSAAAGEPRLLSGCTKPNSSGGRRSAHQRCALSGGRGRHHLFNGLLARPARHSHASPVCRRTGRRAPG